MTLPDSLRRPDRLGRLVLVLMGLWLVWQVMLPVLAAVSGSVPLEASLIRDDAYYQFVTARNLVGGSGFTFDGVHAASGVQVLWTWVLALPALFLGASSLPAASLVLGLGFHLAGGWVLYRLLRGLAPPVVALGISGLFLSRPGLVSEAMNGQETALGLFMVLLWAHVSLPLGIGKPRRRAWIYPVTILLPWARSESLILPLGYLIWTRIGPRFGGSALPWRPVFMPFVLSLLAYLLGQWLFFGSAVPSSGMALPWLFHENFAASHPGAMEWLRESWWFARPVFLGGPWIVAGFGYGLLAALWILAPLSWRKRSLPLLLCFVAMLLGVGDLAAPFLASFLLVFAATHLRFLHMEKEGRIVSALLLGFFGILFLHYVLRWYPRDYYFVSLALPGSLIMALSLRRFLTPIAVILPLEKRLTICWIGLLFLSGADAPRSGARFPWQEEMSFAARQMVRLLPGESIASFNAGLAGFYYDRPVLNLDGAADGASLPALHEKRLLAWMGAQGVDFLLDSPRQVADVDPDAHMTHASGRYLGPQGASALRPFLAFDLPGVGGHQRGSDCQMLYLLPGVAAPDLGVPDRILSQDARGVVLLLRQTTAEGELVRYLLSDADGRERIWRADPGAASAPWLVVRFPQAKGRLKRNGQVILTWPEG